MQQFLAGFLLAFLATALVVWLYFRKKLSGTETLKSKNLNQLEQLSRFTGEIAHEIKNPLSTIKINLKLISEDFSDFVKHKHLQADPDKYRRLHLRALRKITVLQKETDRLEQILNDFLRYVERAEIQPAKADINALISDMIDFYTPQAYSHSITIRQGLYNEPLICKIDENMVKQVILNLFINAQQAMDGGGELIIRTNKQDENAVIHISDTGSGIELEKLNYIFEAFYSSRPAGTGLGLPTAKRIVEAHNGTINVNSEPGKGTSFTIKLPLYCE